MDDIIIYTSTDVQRILKIGKNKANELMNSSSFPSIKIGGVWRVEKNSLEKWINQYSKKQFIM